MVIIGQAIDDRHIGILRHLKDMAMLEQTRHDQIIVPADHTRYVLDGFPLADGDVIRTQINRMPPEPVKAGFERYAGPGRRFGKDHGHRLPGKGLIGFPGFKTGLDFGGQIQGLMYLFFAKIADMQEITFHGKAPVL